MKIYSEDAYHLLHRLGATANYTGFSYLVRALQLCAEEPERLLLVTKWLYPDVAKQYGTNWKAVERNIRTVGRVIWNSNRPLLEDLAHRELSQKPCTAQLLAILHASLLPSGSSTDEE
ncbi:MAG: sporulation initiation factor Spo0A C-terminal domain-containing protein [Flavonifractor plautii]